MTISYGEGQQLVADSSQQVEVEISMDEAVSSLFENSAEAVFGVDSQGKVGYWNKSCENLLGFNGKLEIEGKHCSDLLCGGDKKCGSNCCTECAIQANMDSEKQINSFDLKIKQKNGETVSVNIGTCYFYQSDKNKTSTYFSLRHI